jgi:hypothetical protein
MAKVKQTPDYILLIILLFIFIIALSGGIFYLYRIIMNMTDYIDTKLIPNITSQAVKVILTEDRLDSQNILNDVNRTIVPGLQNTAANSFIPSTTNAIKLNNNAIRLSKNTLICNDVNNIQTCTCLFDTCDLYSAFKNYMLIDRPMGFIEGGTGITMSGNVIPFNIKDNNMRITNQFSLTFYINITNTVAYNRMLFNWNDFSPAFIIRNDVENDYGGKYRNSLDIRFANLGNEGMFNITSDIRGNCVNLPIKKWTHVCLTCSGQLITIYIDGQQQSQIVTQRDIIIGNVDQSITLGRSANTNLFNNPAGILIAKMRWFADVLPAQAIPIVANEYINK